MKRYSELASGTAMAFCVKVFSAGSVFFLNILLSRLLGPEQAGLFFFAQAVMVFIANISRQGFDNVLIRHISASTIVNNNIKIHSLVNYVAKRTIFSSLFLSFFSFSIFYACNLWNIDSFIYSDILYSASFLIVPIAITYFFSYCFQGKKKVTSALLFQNGVISFISIPALYFLSPETAVDAICIYTYSYYVIFSICVLIWYKNYGLCFHKIECNFKIAVNNSAKVLFFITLMSDFVQFFGQFILGLFSKPEQVALFTAALKTSLLVSLILTSVNAIAAPKFSEKYKVGDIIGLEKIVKSSGKYMTFLGVPIIFIMLLFSPYIMNFFGVGFSSASNILRILAVGQFINVITGSVGYLLQMTGNEGVQRKNMFISVFVLVVTSFIFIPLYGAVGAAISTAIAISLQNLLCVYEVKKILGFNTLVFWR